MTAQPIELYVDLPVNAKLARVSFAQVVRDLNKMGGSPDQGALAVYLRDLHVAVRGEIRVPVEMEFSERPSRFQSAISIRALSNSAFFPRFEGTLSLSPSGTTSELWLQGSYQPPLGVLGALLDRTVLRNAARRSLDAFLQRIAKDIMSDEREREERYARDLREMHH
jgi:hypothetical protein